MKREREGGGNTRQERSGGLAPARTHYPRRASSAPSGGGPPRHSGGRPDKVTPRAPTLVSLTLEGPEVHKIVTKGNIHSVHCDLLRIPGPVYSLSANIEQGAVIT